MAVDQAVVGVDWSHDGQFLASANLFESGGNAVHVYRWMTSSVSFVNSIKTTNQIGNAVAWSRNSLHLAYGLEGGNRPELAIHQVVPTSGVFATTNVFITNSDVTSIAWRPGLNQLAFGIGSGSGNTAEVRIISLTGTNLAFLHTNNITGNNPVQTNTLVWHPDGKRYAVAMAAGTTYDINVYSNTTGNSYISGPSLEFVVSARTEAIGWNATGSLFAVGFRSLTEPNRLRVYRVLPNQTFSFLSNAVMAETSLNVFALAWGTIDNLLAVGVQGASTTAALRVYRVVNEGLGSLELIYQEILPNNSADVTSLAWSKDGKYLAAGIENSTLSGNVRLYELLWSDLAVRKTNNPAIARPGSNIVYTITVTNAGPDRAPGEIRVVDLLPNGVTHQSSTSTYNGVMSVDGQAITATFTSFNARTSATITITASVDSNLRTILTNRVAIEGFFADPNRANNTNLLLTYTDFDGDGFVDVLDFCPELATLTNLDSDGDMIGNECDNCPSVTNASQSDLDSDLVGDACDNCPVVANTDQADADLDGIGDVCDACPFLPGNGDGIDDDLDGIDDACDNCPALANSNQVDTDGDGVGNACDNCPEHVNPGQQDDDGDGIGNVCDACPQNVNSGADSDGDGIDDACDPDRDGDLLPNDWEILYGFNPDGNDLVDFETYLDPDQDGYTNLDEYIAGSDPTDAQSMPAVSSIAHGGGVTVGWSSLTGRIYDLYVSTNLMHPSWWLLTGGVAGTGGELLITSTNPASPYHFRYGVKLAP
ncbi:MAG TPA: thrombospondin type 3 repeat-containing protein [Kiritimatiellia bacterium]|nr:thrombospondin type 3 repeat-containing protein [Kiritimatiellia bacterium]HMP34229.1 thrombospondin type 3 repeat-containing protein [Kiritimatiellia bacterium]